MRAAPSPTLRFPWRAARRGGARGSGTPATQATGARRNGPSSAALVRAATSPPAHPAPEAATGEHGHVDSSVRWKAVLDPPDGGVPLRWGRGGGGRGRGWEWGRP